MQRRRLGRIGTGLVAVAAVVAFGLGTPVALADHHDGAGKADKPADYAGKDKAAKTAKADGKACDVSADKCGYNAVAERNIADWARAAPEFATLWSAVQAAGLADKFTGPGPYTLLAPTDDAFRALPAGTVDDLLRPENRDRLTAVLKQHVIPGLHTSGDVAAMTAVSAASGQQLAVARADGGGGPTRVGGAAITLPDIPASNGVIHVIDRVLLPQAGGQPQPS